MTSSKLKTGLLAILFWASIGYASDYFQQEYGKQLPGSTEKVGLWWCSSGWKIGIDKTVPQQKNQAIVIRAARNEVEAVQLVIRPNTELSDLEVKATSLTGPSNSVIRSKNIDFLRVRYVHVTRPTDKSSVAGHWPDPLPPLTKGLEVKANQNQPIWIRVNVPREVSAGLYRGKIQLRARNYQATVPLQVEVYDFTLPDKMTCTTAFGFSPGNVFRYQKINDPQQKRQVLDKYWANFSAHHISPYDPAPLDGIRVTWPKIKPPPSPWDQWENLRIIDNESHTGKSAMLIFDGDLKSNVTTSYKPPIRIPKEGLRIRFWYRTAIPDHQFNVAMNHYDKDDKWLYGKNNDMTFAGNGRWQEFDVTVTEFPAEARFVRIFARATKWTDSGEDIGLVWLDDISVSNPETKEEYISHGDFEKIMRTEPLLPVEQLRPKFNFRTWDQAMSRALDHYHFNSFRLGIAGIGGGTFHARSVPSLLGFTEDTPEYPILFNSYCRQIQEHLRVKGWLEEAFVYWFDEPLPKDYEYIMNGFAKLKKAAPDITRMLTVMVGLDERLYGGPEIWCAVSNKYDHALAEPRRKHGEKFWWYICTGPKAPYCTLFIDHPGTELRVWLWQTWQRNIEGILVWQTNYWTSNTAYPDHPQNPYDDPMGWRTGYGTPKGEKRPWGNGDGRFIYPPEAAAGANPAQSVLEGPVDSIRWEMLRDGIEDYEYLAILKRLMQTHKTKLSKTQVQQYSELLKVPESITKDMTHFTNDPTPIEEQRNKVAQAIEVLSKL
jgi:glycosyl hydrolase family 123